MIGSRNRWRQNNIGNFTYDRAAYYHVKQIECVRKWRCPPRTIGNLEKIVFVWGLVTPYVLPTMLTTIAPDVKKVSDTLGVQFWAGTWRKNIASVAARKQWVPGESLMEGAVLPNDNLLLFNTTYLSTIRLTTTITKKKINELICASTYLCACYVSASLKHYVSVFSWTFRLDWYDLSCTATLIQKYL